MALNLTSLGHELGAHSMNHQRLTTLSAAEIRQDLVENMAAFQPSPAVFRPPFGSTNSIVEKIVSNLGMKQVLWSRGGTYPVDPEDDLKEAHKMRNGDILLLHLEGGEVGDNTEEHLDKILTAIPAHLTRYTVSDCLEQ